VSVIKDDEEIFYHAAGYVNTDAKTSVERRSIFRVYSMTKPVTAVALLLLVDRGLINLQDPVANYIPSFKNMKVLVGGDADNQIGMTLTLTLVGAL